jgi:predicted esterase
MDHRSIFLATSIAVCSVVAGLGGCSSQTSNSVNSTGGQGFGDAAAGTAGSVGSSGSGGGNQDAAQPPVILDGGPYPLPVDAGQTGFLTWTYNGQPVGFYLPPPTGKPLPVVMFLHGCGNNPVNANWWIIAALNKVEPCAVLLPFRPADESPSCSAWGGTYDDDLRPAMVDALAGLDSVIAQYGLDSKRQYLYGESMGAEGVLKLLVQFPTRFAGAVVVGGYTLDKGAEQMAQTALWLIHGAADTINLPASIETIYQSILGVGGTLVKLTEYQGMEHSPAIVKARSEPGLLDWLLAQRHDGIMRSPVVPPVSGDEPDGGATATATVNIEVTDIDAAYAGKSCAVALLAGAADCRSFVDTQAPSGEGKVAAGACTISIPLVEKGVYTACALVDADGNLQLSPGDLATQVSLVVAGDTKEAWSASNWIKI